MTAKIIKIPASMERTHVLIDGKLVKRKNPLPKRAKLLSYTGVAKALCLMSALIAVGYVLGSDNLSDREKLDKFCLKSVEAGNYQAYQQYGCANR